LTLGLAPMTTSVSTTTLDGPHAIFGVVPGGTAGAATALRSYVLGAIRNGRPFTPLVTYNTWFAYGTGVDVATRTAEMDRVAALGTELFVVDAGWYVGAGGSGLFDYESGLGNYAPDSDRFPNGLKPLTDHAHGLGMKFGIWVEPEHVNLSTVGAPGVDESWLATIGGDYGSDTVGQLCFASDAARQWVLNQLTSLIDAVQPDYLKWDNNNWINCDRPGHGHGTTDGNFAHVNGLYDLLASLRDRYPNLLVENVSGGGNRLDAGWLRYSDVAWMDDRTAPSVHVRHSIEGLSALFPPAYLLSFVTDHAGEPIQDAPDLPLYFRSRMEGVLGLCFLSAELSDTDAAAVAAQIAIYKNIRDTLGTSAGTLLTAQAAATDGPAWDVLQETSSDGGQILVQAFQSDDSVDTINVKPQGLDPQTTYNVSSVDTGFLGNSTGTDLTNDGIDIVQSSTSAAHLLVIVAQ
jgi:alpha-galactosidase